MLWWRRNNKELLATEGKGTCMMNERKRIVGIMRSDAGDAFMVV